jgi:uncharacterized protein
MAAAYAGDVAWTDELIRRGLPIDQPDEDGQTALMYSANAGHADVIRLLLANGADINATDRQGSDLSGRDSHGLTARELAAQNGRTSVLHLLSTSRPTE